ncbi:MAG: hypoxanthine phosphoribosyltransferase [Ruminococcaceae bacterium]|nr:hypoxanthine phosphoribosyltransferase [Oscillospiraceae bacterium]
MSKKECACYDERDCKTILLTPEEIDSITTRLARAIEETYKDSPKQLVLVVILKGSMPFATDLMRKIHLPLQLEFMKVSSYGVGTKASGEIRIHLDLLREDLPECDVLVIEDIVDSGRTLSRLTQLLKNRNVNSVKTCTLLDKPSRREVPFVPDFCGVQIPDEFVIGYGLDYAEEYRNLPFIGVLKPEIYS